MASQEYWKNRETEAKKHNIIDEEEYNRQIQEIYQSMIDEITKEINGFYARYAKKEGVTMAEAKKRADKLDIDAYARKAKKYVAKKDFSDEANEEMRIYNLTMKVNRLELLKANIGLEMVSGFDDLQKYFDKKLTKRTLDEFRRQAGILGKSIMKNEKYAHAIVNASFKNATYSDRIWMYHGMLKAELEGLLASGLIKGENPRKLARHLTKRFGVSAYNAERLMVTELARVQTEAQKQSFIRNGFDEYVYVACTKGDVCPICKGLDDKHFKVDDMMPGENAPPMHPNCHCSTAAYMDNEAYEEWINSYQEHGLNFEDWKASKESEELRKRRKERMAQRLAEKAEAINKNGQAVQFDWKGNPHKEQEQIITRLTKEYNTRLQHVTVGAKKAAGTVDMSGATMNLSAKDIRTAVHEFAHTMANSAADKYGLTNDGEFWKEIKKIRRAYKKDVDAKQDTSRWISGYEHGSSSIDEFFAEAFTQAKLKEMGIKLPSEYGSDFTYSKKVLTTVDKYFKKSNIKINKTPVKTVAKGKGNDIINSGAVKGALTDKNDPLYVKRDAHAIKYYESVRRSKKSNIVKSIANNTGISEKSINKVYDHVFINDHELYGGKRRFDPDYDMAESFRRLREGKNIQKHDLIMLKHERLEYELMKKEHLSYQEAHRLAEKKYNYQKALMEFKKKNNL